MSGTMLGPGILKYMPGPFPVKRRDPQKKVTNINGKDASRDIYKSILEER